jgi:signal-transduction protein with cAMP-binding, CBS, and nucleotidyltransferase domain
MNVADVALRPPVTIRPEATIAEAARLMASAGVGALVVIETEHPVGIVTDRDLVIRALAKHVPDDGRIDSVMSTNVVAVEGSSDIREAMRAFSHHAVRRLPVITAGRVMGMLTVDDVVVALSQQFSEVTRGVTAQLLFPHGLDEPEPPVRVST